MRSIVILLVLSLSQPGWADNRPLVVFFGGYKASAAQMAAWKTEVQKRLPNYEVLAIPYPSSSANGGKAVEAAQATLRRLAEKINGEPGRPVVIAGHSSGAALSNALARQVTDSQNVRLVALDGYSPDQTLQRKFNTTCWSSQNGANRARNYASLKANCGGNFRVFHATEKKCTSAWCLHFAVVNTNARFTNDWQGGGYKNLIPNLEWIEAQSAATSLLNSAEPEGAPGSR